MNILLRYAQKLTFLCVDVAYHYSYKVVLCFHVDEGFDSVESSRVRINPKTKTV